MTFYIAGLDSETTGLDPMAGHEIIELCLAVYKTDDLLNFQPLGEPWVQRIKPTRPIDKAAEEVHGISLKDLRGCPEWKDVAGKAHKIISKCHLLVAHNLEFDALFLAVEFGRVGLKVPSTAGYCTMENNRDVTAMGKQPSLKELCWAYDIEYSESEAHSASYDTQKMLEAMFEGIRRGRIALPLHAPAVQEMAA